MISNIIQYYSLSLILCINSFLYVPFLFVQMLSIIPKQMHQSYVRGFDTMHDFVGFKPGTGCSCISTDKMLVEYGKEVKNVIPHRQPIFNSRCICLFFILMLIVIAKITTFYWFLCYGKWHYHTWSWKPSTKFVILQIFSDGISFDSLQCQYILFKRMIYQLFYFIWKTAH